MPCRALLAPGDRDASERFDMNRLPHEGNGVCQAIYVRIRDRRGRIRTTS
jgi:hypothetical protein